MSDWARVFDDFRICITERGCTGCSRVESCRGLRSTDEVEISKALALDVLNTLKELIEKCRDVEG